MHGLVIPNDSVWFIEVFDFSQTQFIQPDFRGGIDLTQQRLPPGPECLYVADAPSAIARLQSGLEGWKPNPEVRRVALIWADSLTRIVKKGQRQLLMRPEGDYLRSEDSIEREALDIVFGLYRMRVVLRSE
jgi:hypothetical protein